MRLMDRKSLILFLFLIGIFTTHALKAEPLPGADDPDFLAAVESWLDDNDEDSLPSLSALANDGNIAARLLLARIEETDRASSEFVKNLSRQQRLDLFRPPSETGAFRPSWLKFESKRENKTATTLLDATQLGINIDAIRRLQKLGETEAAEYLVKKVAVDGSREEIESVLSLLDPDAELVPYLKGFLYAADGQTTGQAALQYVIGLAGQTEPETVESDENMDAWVAGRFLDIGYQSGSRYSRYGPDNSYYTTITAWLTTAPQSAAIASLCRNVCTVEEVSSCANTALGLIGGYYEVIRFDSPLESVVPQSRFIHSRRATGMTLRRLASSRSEAGEQIFTPQDLSKRSQCLAEAVAGLRD